VTDNIISSDDENSSMLTSDNESEITESSDGNASISGDDEICYVVDSPDDNFVFEVPENGIHDHFDIPDESTGTIIRVPLGRAVWETFNGAIPDGYVIDHINGNRCDNRLVNLRMVPITEYNKHLGELKSVRFERIRENPKNFMEKLRPRRR
jgi:hypothetical protein